MEILMNNIQRMLKRINKGTVASTFILLFFFTGTVNASLSGIPPGYPRIKANKVYLDNYQSGTPGVMYFDAYNVNNKVFWDQSPAPGKEKIKQAPDFYLEANLDVSSNPYSPTILEGFLEVWGRIDSLGTSTVIGDDLLFRAELKDVYSTNKIIEFVMDGTTQTGQVCDLGFCSFTDEVVQFKLRKLDANFNGDFSKTFYKTATGIATVPVPAAVWLFGSAFMGLAGFQRRKITTKS